MLSVSVPTDVELPLAVSDSGRVTVTCPTMVVVIGVEVPSQLLLAKSAFSVDSDVVAFSPMVNVAGSVVSPDALLRASVAPAKVSPNGPSATMPLAGPWISSPSTNCVAESSS